MGQLCLCLVGGKKRLCVRAVVVVGVWVSLLLGLGKRHHLAASLRQQSRVVVNIYIYIYFFILFLWLFFCLNVGYFVLDATLKNNNDW